MSARALPLSRNDRGERERALDETARRAARALDDDARLAERWRLLRRFDLTMPTPATLDARDVVGRAPACDVCRTPCCARPEGIVSLRLSDTARLLDRGLGFAVVEPATLLARFPSIERALGPLVHRESFTHAFALDKRDDGTCVFFEDARCTIHDVKPLACRAFPYQLDDDRARVRFASSCESERPCDEAETRAHVASAIESYAGKVADVVTRAFARDDVRDLVPLRTPRGCP